jgi:Lhr-like helicase
MAQDVVHNEMHGVAICRRCQTCLSPQTASHEQHFRRRPHQLSGTALKAVVLLLSRYSLSSVQELKQHKPRRDDQCLRIPDLASYSGYGCLETGCNFYTRRRSKINDHMRIHNKKASEHKNNPLWEECELQTYFTAKGRIDYFPVVGVARTETKSQPGTSLTPPTVAEDTYFQRVEDDYARVEGDLRQQAQVVRDFGDSKSARVPWLERTAFPSHLAGLKDDEIKRSYELPKKTDVDVKGAGDELGRILAATEAVLQDAYLLCSDKSPDRKMTQQRANILSEFYVGASGKAVGFRYYKNASTLVKYFTTWKQLIAYYYRVVHCKPGHFSYVNSDQKLPQDVVQPSDRQVRAMASIVAALSNGDDVDLKSAIRWFCMTLICQIVGSLPFRSPVLSFCAMLSRRFRRRGESEEGQGLWMEPGNFNSHLSALTWTAQLLIFDHACFEERDNEDQIPVRLSKICRKYFQQLAETPFGHILQWRLYLFPVGKADIAKHQARWSLDGQVVTYRGVELPMSHVPRLVTSEFQQASSLLHDELMFQTEDLAPMQSWRLQDDLDLEDFGASWISLRSNAEFVSQSGVALLRLIRASAELRAMFMTRVRDGEDRLCPQAMAMYEANAQEFLKRVLILCHIPPGQPLRESELLSVTWQNTARPRHLMLWEKTVMIHTQYHKGQEQSGVYKENVRFLPKPIGDLVLTYLAYVLPLRQIFLRQQTPGALISPYLWAKLDGTVWPDGVISACLSKACARAMVPRLHTANWRQISATICKEKFSGRDQANFDLDDHGVEDVEDDLELVAMAEQGNHSYATFNHAYAGTTTLTTSALLHRNHRASTSWHTLFRFEDILSGKRARPSSGTLSIRMLDASKRSQFRRKGVYSQADLVAVARKLYQNPSLQLRAPGQRDGLLATLGPQSAEQVVLILGTGSGKSLIFMVGASVADARTTILVVPMIALRGDLLRRCLLVGIRPLIWTQHCKQSASLVLVSAEAVCTEAFLTYAHGLVAQQELARIVIDECHLTITAGDYRSCMLQLGWYVRQIRTQTVWLTATLPPVRQEEFIEQNKLVMPCIVRESTNRPNIQYMVRTIQGKGTLVEKAATFVPSCWAKQMQFDAAKDKVIVYCRTRQEAISLAELLGCDTYTSASGTDEEKGVMLSEWIVNPEQPVIVATSALGVGFDYPHVRWVIHVDAPDEASAFSQASGRAGRDGGRAFSMVLLSASWKPQTADALDPEREAMQTYLSQEHCYRGVLSQFLDDQADWRWCMVGEEACGVCCAGHVQTRPSEVRFHLSRRQEIAFTGPEEVLRQDHLQDETLDRYERDLEIMKGCCLYCRIAVRPFDHLAHACPRRFDWIRAKTLAYETRKREGKDWIQRFTACWKCYQPQTVCRVADPEHEESRCRFPDMVMPLCYAVYFRRGRDAWLQRHFRRRFPSVLDYMLWLGEAGTMAGSECIQANCVALIALAELG